MFSTTRFISYLATFFVDCAGDFDDDGAGDDVGHFAVTEKGGSYRTIQRFFATSLPWGELFMKFFETQLFDPTSEYILAGDATTILKSGKQTHGIGRFFREFKVKLSRA